MGLPIGWVECVALPYHIPSVPDSCLGQETGRPDFPSYPQDLQAVFSILGPASN